jgi:hypothetical protein
VARIISGKQGNIVGRPGFLQLPKGNFVREGVRRLMRRDPAAGVTTVDFPARVEGTQKAVLTQVMAGANNDMKFTSKISGVDGNNIRVRFVNPGGTASRTIVVSGLDITVNLAVTAGAINSTETAESIRNSINADASAKALITAETAEGNGSGVVAAFAFTNLTGAPAAVMSQRRPPELQDQLFPGPSRLNETGLRRFVPGGIKRARIINRGANRSIRKR